MTTTTKSLSKSKKTVLEMAKEISECKDEDQRAEMIRVLIGDEDPLVVASKTNRPEDVLGAIRYAGPDGNPLLNSKSTRISTSFGGQGVGSKYLTELKKTLVAFPSCKEFALSLIREVRDEYETKDCPRDLFSEGFELENWISPSDASQQPSESYLSSTTVSYALIGVSQLVQYYALVNCVYKGDFAKAQSRWNVSVGHSQGIMSALAVACGKDRDQFELYSVRVVKCLFWTGVRAQEQRVSARTRDGMLGVRGLTPEQLEMYVKIVRSRTKTKIAISLINGAKRCVVSGSAVAIEMLSAILSDKKSNAVLPSSLRIHFDKTKSQSRVPYSKRLLENVSVSKLPISVGFHYDCEENRQALEQVMQDMSRLDIHFDTKDMTVPVLSTLDATDLSSSSCLLKTLLSLQLLELVSWPVVLSRVSSSTSHLLSFGPSVGFSAMTRDVLKGRGTQVIHAVINTLGQIENSNTLRDISAVISSTDRTTFAASWRNEFEPKLNPEGMLETKWTRRLKMPCVMIAGMTPTTSLNGVSLVAAAANAGYWAELAGGGLPRAHIFRDRVEMLCSKLNPGVGFYVNLLYLNTKQWRFQFPLTLKLRAEGFPVLGITIGAGVPSHDRAMEILSDMVRAGIHQISFKPGSLDSINAVIEIAREAEKRFGDDLIVVMQWTGGRGGGHHSFEDMHDPIFQSYHELRSLSNLLLVAGSGIGDAESAFPYLSGTWQKNKLVPNMPFDAVLVASRVMVAKEASTALEVKRLIVKTPGLNFESENLWESSYDGEAGGVLTVQSELGEPIHKIANRGTRLWRDFDRRYFRASGKTKPEREKLILRNKKEIARALNDNFQKVYFATKSSGEIVELHEMTYAELLNRMISLMYVPERWLDVTYRDMVQRILHRVHERFCATSSSPVLDLSSISTENPTKRLKTYLDNVVPRTKTQLVLLEDVDYFLRVCRVGKPVPFVPIIDGDLETWFKKDSLWYSEDLDAVPDRDADRVVVLHGPISARYSTKVNEPVSQILGNILIDLSKRFHVVDKTHNSSSRDDKSTNTRILKYTNKEMSEKKWFECIAQDKTWIRDALQSLSVVGHDKRWIKNPIRALFAPILNDQIKIAKDEIVLCRDQIERVRLAYTATKKSNNILATLFFKNKNTFMNLNFESNNKSYIPLRFCLENEEKRSMKLFYAKIWKVEDLLKKQENTSTFVVHQDHVERFCKTISSKKILPSVPMDYLIVAAWQPIASCLLRPDMPSMLKLVHLSNEYEWTCKQWKLRQPVIFGDVLDTSARVIKIQTSSTGRTVVVRADVKRENRTIVSIVSSFLFRGNSFTTESDFTIEMLDALHENVSEIQMNETELKILRKKPWFKPSSLNDSSFSTVSFAELKIERGFQRCQVTGDVYAVCGKEERVNIGTVQYKSSESDRNVVVEYLKRVASRTKSENSTSIFFFENGGQYLLSRPHEIISPLECDSYAEASGDLNPIHSKRHGDAFVKLANLPGAIVHGMWTFANARGVLERTFSKQTCGLPGQICIDKFRASFEGMVIPGSKLYTQLKHVGMRRGGIKIVEIETVDERGQLVLKGMSEISPQRECHVFTGQGSAAVNMGMDLYRTSEIARQVWDRADKHLMRKFGFSILNIVRENPKQLTLFFGGRRGQAIRNSYVNLQCVAPPSSDGSEDRDDKDELVPLIPEIRHHSERFSFEFPDGLLFATQFTQPALVLTELAAYRVMQSKGIISSDAMWCGHSLGEYAALSSISEVLAIESLVELVFVRGLVMQRAVPRDSIGRSDYGMVAASPMRVHPTKFQEKDLIRVVESVSECCEGRLLQIVNFNVDRSQYVAAGHLICLEALSETLNAIRDEKDKRDEETIIRDVSSKACKHFQRYKMSRGEMFQLKRGKATIPLPGIDVPFHSKYLLGGVPIFRDRLLKQLTMDRFNSIRVSELLGRYIPNVVAKPFSLSQEFVQDVYEVTHSKAVQTLISELKESQWNELRDFERGVGEFGVVVGKTTHTLLVELLAYQFASPVRWIETQRVLFQNHTFGRFIEIGPSATLTTMAKRTLKGFYKTHEWTLRCTAKEEDMDMLFCRVAASDDFVSSSDFVRNVVMKEEEEEENEEEKVEETKGSGIVVVQALPVPSSPVPVTTTSQDVPKVTTTDIVRAMIGSKLKISLEKVSTDSSIQRLVGGKSALQNEIVGDLSAEFECDIPEDGASMSVQELCTKLAQDSKIFQGRLGKSTSRAISSILRSKMPPSLAVANKVKTFLGEKYFHGDMSETENITRLADSTLLTILSSPPSTRLSDNVKAREYVDRCVSMTLRRLDLSLPLRPQQQTQQRHHNTTMTRTAPLEPVPDVPISSMSFMEALVTSKLKRRVENLGDTTLRDVCAGKSALMNEMVGDIGTEFELEDASDSGDTKISSIASSASYSRLGKIGNGLVSRILGKTLPGGMSVPALRRHLNTERLLGPGRVETILLECVTELCASTKKKRFENVSEATRWVDNVVDRYASKCKINIPRQSAVSSSFTSNAQNAGTIDSAALRSVESKMKRLVRNQIETMRHYLCDDNEKRSTKRLALMTKSKIETLNHERDLFPPQHEHPHSHLYEVFENEYGFEHAKRIEPKFKSNTVRTYSSCWNWAVQDALELYYMFANYGVNKITGEIDPKSTTSALKFFASDPFVSELNMRLTNKYTKQLMHVFSFFAQKSENEGNIYISQGVRGLHKIASDCLRSRRPTTYNAQIELTRPDVSVKDGVVSYKEIPRLDSMEAYVVEMCKGANLLGDDVESSQNNVRRRRSQSFATTSGDEDSSDHEDLLYSSVDSIRRKRLTSDVVRSDRFTYRSFLGQSAYSNNAHDQLRSFMRRHNIKNRDRMLEMPFLHIASQMRSVGAGNSHYLFDEKKTMTYFDCLRDMIEPGVSFTQKVALVTGCGKGSIGSHIVRALLEGGATVVCTSSSAFRSVERVAFFRDMYTKWGGCGSKLYLAPLNAASAQDTRNVVRWIYEMLGLDIDFVIPFAATSEAGKSVDDIDAAISEVSHRMMLTNVLRLIGEIKIQKERRNVLCRPALVVLPLSPNHGAFGSDGLYAESKLGLESLMNKWQSEQWSDFVSIAGAVIGWTRGTGLMDTNNMLAASIESCGVRTFSAGEMALNIMTLLHPQMVSMAGLEPVWADFGGDFNKVERLNELATRIRKDVLKQASNAKLFREEEDITTTTTTTKTKSSTTKSENKRSLESSALFPALPLQQQQHSESNDKNILSGMVDLDTTVVITGFGETGPFGSSRTRWEMESFGELSLEGCIELAWLMGMIKYHDKNVSLPSGEKYTGWIDAQDGSPVADMDIKSRYEERILSHTGIRLLEPEQFGGYDGKTKRMLAQVAIDADMAPVELSSEIEARQFKAQLGDKAEIWCDKRDDEMRWWMRLRRGAVVAVPRALRFDRFVAGQIPKGWDAKRLGVPPEIVDSVDPVTLFALVSTAEALISSGVTDPYEFYKYVHVSQVGNTSGGGLGGSTALRGMFRGRILEGEDGENRFEGQGDLLQETFINSMSAYVNLLLLSSSGPIKTPVGACATAAESVAIGVETIVTGQAKIVVVGGYDDFQEEGSYEFAQMGATVNTEEDAERNRFPSEASRPTTSSRSGFVESAGAGMQILMSASLALKMGVPIYGIVGLAKNSTAMNLNARNSKRTQNITRNPKHRSNITGTATDKQGRSIPKPGRGILTTARETSSCRKKDTSLSYRRRRLIRDLERIAEDLREEDITQEEAHKSARYAVRRWGNEFYRSDSSISPLRGALAVWGLNVDDITVASFHGTSTKANDVNESAVTHAQMEHLGRTRGNPLMVVCQKWLTGHPKGAAAAWMLNGMLQTLNSGIVPGNRNADDIDPKFEAYHHLFYPCKSMCVGPGRIKAVMLKSFGFGQAGAEILLIHPNLLFEAAGMRTKTNDSNISSSSTTNRLEDLVRDLIYSHESVPTMTSYVAMRKKRECDVFRYIQEVRMGRRNLFEAKNAPPYTSEDEEAVYLDPTARAVWTEEFGWRVRPSSVGDNDDFVERRNALTPSPPPIPVMGMMKQDDEVEEKQDNEKEVPSLPSVDTRLEVMLRRTAQQTHKTGSGVGIDVEPVSTFQNVSSAFLERNFTSKEIAYCQSAPSPCSSFAGRWAAKEAVIKAISCSSLDSSPLWAGASKPLIDIEIMASTSGAPRVTLRGHAKRVADVLGVSLVKVSISHTDTMAIAQAIAE